MLAEDLRPTDDGIPHKEVSPLSYLTTPVPGLTAGVAGGTVLVMVVLAVCVYYPYPKPRSVKD